MLNSLDDKIDLLHCQNAILEKMAETLFRQWFVEEAKEEWEMGKLGDVLEFNYGKNLPQKERAGSGYPVYGSSGITGYHTEFLVKGPGIITGRKGICMILPVSARNLYYINKYQLFLPVTAIFRDGLYFSQ